MARESQSRSLTTKHGLTVEYTCPKWSEILEEHENQVDWLVSNYATKIWSDEDQQAVAFEDLYAYEVLEIHDCMMRGYGQDF